mgnify:CR=1 FL=1
MPSVPTKKPWVIIGLSTDFYLNGENSINLHYWENYTEQNANKLKSIFISNNSFYLLQLKGCHEQHLIAIYVFFVEEAIDARIVWKNIGKKMGRDGAALTIA